MAVLIPGRPHGEYVLFVRERDVAQGLPPEVAMKLLRIAFEFSDLPNKQEITDELRRMTGERDPNKEMTPEEQQIGRAHV